MGGSNTLSPVGYQTGVFGTLGVPSPANIPGSRLWAQTWTDNNGNLWLFGGHFADETNTVHYRNDLWKYDPKANEWAWMSGSNTQPCVEVQSSLLCGQPGIYGTQGTADPRNTPGGRYGAVAWTDANGHLWLFGGDGLDSAGNLGELNDLWEFDPSTNQWTWQGGGSTIPESAYGFGGVFGTQGAFSSSNHPGSLMFEVAWHDHNDHTWLFGGWGNDVNNSGGLPNNLWQFESSPVEWAWMDGRSDFSAIQFQPTVFGSVGVPASENIPGSRWNGSTWTGPDNKLWLFGGQGYDSTGNGGELNEFWQYDPSINEWTWMAGNSTMNCAGGSQNQNCGTGGVYGVLGVPSSANLPGGRTDASQWTGADGNFWLFGGQGFNGGGVYAVLNDLWEFNPQKAEWTWIGGSNVGGQGGIYGTLGTPSPANIPGGRHAAASWTDADGNLWLFAGNALDANGQIGQPNDFWRYSLAEATTPPPPPPPADFALALGAQALTVNSGQSASTTLTITPQNSFASTVSFTCSGLPAGASCAFLPSSVTPSGAPGSSTLTISTSAIASSRPGSRLPIPAAALALVLLCKRHKRLLRLSIFVLTAAAFTALTACSSYTLSNPVQPIQPVTSTVTVTAQSGTLIHSATLTLTIE